LLNRSVALLLLTSQHMETIPKSVRVLTCARCGLLCTCAVSLQTLDRAWRSERQHRDRKWESNQSQPCLVSKTLSVRGSKPSLSVELCTSHSARLCRAQQRNFGTRRNPQPSCLPQPLCVLALRIVQGRIWRCCSNTNCRLAQAPPLFHMGKHRHWRFPLGEATNQLHVRVQRRRQALLGVVEIHRKGRQCPHRGLILYRSNQSRLMMCCASWTGSVTFARTRRLLDSGAARSVPAAPLSMCSLSRTTFSTNYLSMSPSRR